ncbi:TIR domain-containing protein [Heliobacterium chlorum]|uniref:TIR domain-containing protein n=1 Tax=Heliobacterium chlorum TaxID=2698 RepID=UPI00165E9278
MDKIKIYISYSWAEEDNEVWVDKLIHDLYDEKLELVFDKNEINKGTSRDIDRFVYDNMLDSDYIIIIITPSYIEKANLKYDPTKERSWVEKETDYIIKRFHNDKESLIPILYKRKDNRVELPKSVSGLSYYDMSNQEMYDTELKRIKEIISRRKSDNEKNEVKGKLIHYSASANQDIDMSYYYSEYPVRISSTISYGNLAFYLNHNQTVELFLKSYKETLNIKNNLISFNTNAFNMLVPSGVYKKLNNKVFKNKNLLLNKLKEFEAKFEVTNFDLIDNKYKYKLLRIGREHWKLLISVANEYDWELNKTKWNIFQHNNDYIHVYTPTTLNDVGLNRGEHAIFRAEKDKHLLNDDVNIYISINDITKNRFEEVKINKSDSWGVRTAYTWLTNSFIPFICDKNRIRVEDFIKQDYYKLFYNDDIFSKMQSFYSLSNVIVSYDEIIILRDILCFCLNRVHPVMDYYYIASKISAPKFDNSDSPNIISRKIIDYLGGKRFESIINLDGNNSQLADSLLRCIRVFTDLNAEYKQYKLNSEDLTYIENLAINLIIKMKEIQLLEKYNF